MKQCNNSRKFVWWPLPLLLLASLLQLIPNWLDPQLPATHEGYRYLMLGDWFREAIAAGIWYPRWFPEMNGGFGYPQFVFYQPAYFYLNAFASLFAEPLFLRQLLTLSIIAIMGGVGLYLLARQFVSPLYSLLLVLLFQLAPYTHTNLFIRGDFSEWMALELLPWPVLFIWRFCRAVETGNTKKRIYPWLGLALGTAVLCYCHPTALMFVPLVLLFIGVFCLLRVTSTIPWLFLMEMAGAIFLGLLLSAPYWLVVVQMKPLVNVSTVLQLDDFIATNNGIGLQRLLFGSLQHDPFFELIGFPFLVATLVGWWLGRRQPLIFSAGLTCLFLLLLITPFGSWFWHLYPFSLLQFPWRLAMFAPLLQVVCLLGYANLSGKLWRGLQVAGLLSMVAWSCHGHFGFTPVEIPGLSFDQQTMGCLRNIANSAKPGSYPSTLDAGEWLPATAAGIRSTPARGQQLPECAQTELALSKIIQQTGWPDPFDQPPQPLPLLQVGGDDWAVHQNPASSDFRLDYILKGNSPTTVTINQIYLPGWQVKLNSQPLSAAQLEEQLLPDGRISLAIKPGEWHLQAGYIGPPGYQWRNLLIFLSVLLAVGYWYRKTCHARLSPFPPGEGQG